MTDEMYDAKRGQGEYPWKGWGWQDPEFQTKWLKEAIANGRRDPWILRECKWRRIEVPNDCDD